MCPEKEDTAIGLCAYVRATVHSCYHRLIKNQPVPGDPGADYHCVGDESAEAAKKVKSKVP